MELAVFFESRDSSVLVSGELSHIVSLNMFLVPYGEFCAVRTQFICTVKCL